MDSSSNSKTASASVATTSTSMSATPANKHRPAEESDQTTSRSSSRFTHEDWIRVSQFIHHVEPTIVRFWNNGCCYEISPWEVLVFLGHARKLKKSGYLAGQTTISPTYLAFAESFNDEKIPFKMPVPDTETGELLHRDGPIPPAKLFGFEYHKIVPHEILNPGRESVDSSEYQALRDLASRDAVRHQKFKAWKVLKRAEGHRVGDSS
ncbi:hypothetical protein D9758_010039 [Tetrapyrgos nigripes]|uniref:Uncharacterized protein n=1 Tax=Tetrapyrgos nigripes TaxID=182062 RepID=A0A8H5CU24_9AGAR|nr:hypothetical protein D9758_010039 [Tetrapyrgos nigripes]